MDNSKVFSVLLGGTLAGSPLYAQTPTSVAPDNSRTNKVDASNAAATADTQSNTAMDIDLTKRIRQSVMADKPLSTNAHNVKIVTNGGHEKPPTEKPQIVLAASCSALTNAFRAAPYSLLVATGHAELMTMINRSSLNVVIDWPKMPTAS
jgi:hypothetical protein